VSPFLLVPQKAGLITYTRGNVTILNRDRLEKAACDCYRLLQQHIKNWQSEDEQSSVRQRT
jgi:hypothetical protein